MKLIAVMSLIGLLLPIIGSINGSETKTDYCSLTCRMPTIEYDAKRKVLVPTTIPNIQGTHVLCKSFKHDDRCPPKRVSLLSEDDKQLVLEEHNKIRNNVASGLETRGRPGPQPRACNMMEIGWDDELEEVAKKMIMECNYHQYPCMDVPRFEVSVNVFAATPKRTGNQTVLTEAIKSWSKEVQLLSGEFGRKRRQQIRYSYDAPTIGVNDVSHYSHMVVAATMRIGCVSATAKNDSTQNRTLEYLACIYGPKGIKKGQPLYLEGPPCSKCPAGSRCSKQWPALCDTSTNRNAQDAIYIPPGEYSKAVRIEATSSLAATLLLSTIVWI